MTIRGFVCGLPCGQHELSELLPWPPELPGYSNWANGDEPVICAYLHSIGERLLASEKRIGELEALVRQLESRTVGQVAAR